MPTDTPALGRFGHHPDPTIDFCVEVEEIDAIHYDVRTGIAKDKEDERNRRIARAMSFRVGGDEKAVAAKDRLRAIKREAAPPNPAAEVVARLREAADNIERARMSGIVENLAGWEQRAVREAAECIAHLNAERLSRERDTATNWINGLEDTICEGISYISGGLDTTALFELERVLEDRSCLEQRPTFLTPVRSLEPYRSAKADVSRERDTGVPEELLNTVAEWAKWARTWSGSAFLSGDPVENDEENRGALYTDLCKLGNHMIWLEDELLKLRSAAPQPPTVSTQGWQDGALKDIGIERLRQMSVEGWTPEHDDTHDQFEMARAAAFYCVTTYAETLPEPTPDEPSNRYSAFHTADCAWPSTWDGCWRKPKDARRNLVRAAALIVAEIERLDRANGAPPAHVQPDLSTLTRERDQAREALAFYANPDNWNEDGQCFAGRVPVPMWASDDHGDTFIDGHLDLGATARSVLHPEKPEVTHDT